MGRKEKEHSMKRLSYLAQLAAKRAFRERKGNRGTILVFAAAVAAIALAEGTAAGAARNVREFYSLRLGGSAFLCGFEREEKGRLVGLSALEDLEPALSALPGGSIAHRRTAFTGRLRAHGKSAVASVQGLDFTDEAATLASLPVVAGDWKTATDGRGIVIGKKAAAALGVGPGYEAILEARDCRGRATIEAFEVAAVEDEPALVDEGSVWLSLAAANRLRGYAEGEFGYLALDGVASTPEAGVALAKTIRLIQGKAEGTPLRLQDPGPVVRKLAWEGRAYLLVRQGDLALFPLNILEGILLAARALAAVILCLAAIGVSSSFRMLVMERPKELGALRAMGATRKDARRLVALEAIMTGFAGGLVGLAAGGAGLALLGLVALPQGGGIQIYLHGGRFRPLFEPAMPLLALAAATLAAAIGAGGPARAASRIEPAAAIGEGIA